MSVPDAKTRTKISLNPSKILSTSIPSRLLPKLLLSNVLLVASLLAGKEWLLDLDVGVFWVTMRVLACGGVGALVWEGFTGQLTKRKSIEWPVLGMASILLFVQQGCLFTALYRLSPIRVLFFTQFSTLWVNVFIHTHQGVKASAIGAAILLSLVSDAQFSTNRIWNVLPAYTALAVHGLASSALDHTYRVLSPGLGVTFTIAASTLGASLFALPFYLFRTVLVGFSITPALPLFSLALVPFMAYSLLFLSPVLSHSTMNVSPISQHFVLSFPFTSISVAIFGPLAFAQIPSWADLFVGSLLFYGMSPDSNDAFSAAPRTPTSRLFRSYLKTILSNPESRKIFYFLMLNMCYMLVQMLYGVWTNSLGLISDAIHMAFDCMAIGVGLFASVMATWEPNERFTYGYGRIETLSGFANGIFLILISIFIVFEAIQRILDPPEMEINQLLLVSSLGLAVNLFGMFAMGGHHHHGHSHSHGHSHGSEDHSHSHSVSPLPSSPHVSAIQHSAEHSHSNLSNHSHSDHHTHSHSPEHCHSDNHTHSHPSEHSIDQSQSHHEHSHSHSLHSPAIDHPTHSHTHSHAATGNVANHHSRGQSLQIDHLSHNGLSLEGDIASPITPSYSFTHDEHYHTHQQSGPAPNLHDHSHAPSHEGHSHNMRGVFLHVMADTLGSVGVIISTLLIQFYGWTGFDPIASLFIAVLIAASVIPLVVDTGKVLALDIDERSISIQHALAELSSIEGLSSFTDPRFWPKDATSLIGSIHIQLAPSPASFDPHGPHLAQQLSYRGLDRVVENVDALLRRKIPGLEELTIQVEGTRLGN